MDWKQQGGARALIVRIRLSEDVNRQRKGEEMVMDLKGNVFPDRAIHFLAVKDGKKEVRKI
ncbi:MAG: hypothetical protein ABL907_09510 [Hyphomicrobium sp.]